MNRTDPRECDFHGGNGRSAVVQGVCLAILSQSNSEEGPADSLRIDAGAVA